MTSIANKEILHIIDLLNCRHKHSQNNKKLSIGWSRYSLVSASIWLWVKTWHPAVHPNVHLHTTMAFWYTVFWCISQVLTCFNRYQVFHSDPMASHKAHLPLVELLWLCGLASPPGCYGYGSYGGGISDPGSWIPLKNIWKTYLSRNNSS
jgi:hypothetical protein